MPIKLTINGIDGFKSGKWTLHPNARAIDDETLELNSNSTYNTSQIKILVIPNQAYILEMIHNSGMSLDVYSANNTLLGSYSGQKQVQTVLMPPNADYIIIKAYNYAASLGKFTFKRPMLNLGSIPAPYEPKRGDRMVLPVAKGNIVSVNTNYWESGTVDGAGEPIANGTRIRTKDFVPVSDSSKMLFVAINSGFQFHIYEYDSDNKVTLASGWKTGTYCFTPKNNTVKYKILISFSNNDNIIVSDIHKASLIVYDSVQLNPKPKKFVPRKNLFDKRIATAGKVIGSGGNISDNANYTLSDFTPVKANITYVKNNLLGVAFYDTSKAYYSFQTGINSFTPTRDGFVRFNVDSVAAESFQLEEGSTATPYEPYQLGLPKPRTGLVMEDKSYLEVGNVLSSSKYEVEAEFKIKEFKGHSGIISFRSSDTARISLIIESSARKLAYWDSNNGWRLSDFIIELDTFYKVKWVIERNNKVSFYVNDKFIGSQSIGNVPFVNTAWFGKTNNSSEYFYGVFKNITVDGVKYDFENPNNIVGDKVIPNAKNLIPSFEDSRWNLHANAKVLGKDVLRLDATSAIQTSSIRLPVSANQKYYFTINSNGSVQVWESRNGAWTRLDPNTTKTFEFTPLTNEVEVRLTNAVIGTFDFIRPQLYELTGKEATIFGKPAQTLKAPKRTLYNKR